MHPAASLRAAALGLTALATVAASVSAQFPAVTFNETAVEFSGRADVDGNSFPDVIVVDKVSGTVRVCYQTAAGVFQWDEPKASGIADVTGVSAGRLLLATRDALVVTAPEANRINLIAPTLGGAIVPQSIFVSPIGPVSVAVSNLNGTIAVDDLWTGSALNSAPNPGSFDQFVNSPAGTFAFNANRQVSAGYFDRTNNVTVKTSLAGTFAYMERLPASDTLRVLSPAEATAPVRLTVAGLPPNSAYLIAPFAGATYACALTWAAGDPGFASRVVSEPVPGTFALAAPLSFTLPFPVGQLLLVPTNGNPKLFAISKDGSTAAYFDFDGSTLSAAIDTLTAPAGEQFTGGVALPGFQGFHLLRGAAGDGRTTTSRYLKWNASAGKFGDVGGTSFPAAGKRAGAGNVLLFSGEPFVSPTATLVSRLNARDWSSGTPPIPPATVSVTGELDRGTNQGLGGPSSVTLGAPPAGVTNVLLNQYRPFLSIFGISRADGTSIGEPFIAPDGGLFARTVQLSFTAPAGMTVYFRDTGGAWIPYVAPGVQPTTNPGDPGYEAWFAGFRPLLRFKNTTVEYYGQVGAKRSPIKTAAFKFTVAPDQLSSLGDGVPDYVKLGLHYNPFLPPPNLNPTEQGSFLNRLLAGLVSDPRLLTPSALNLFVRPMSLNGYSLTTVPSVLAGTVLPDGSSASGNQILAYDAGGTQLTQGDDTTPPAGINDGLRIWNPPFAEPSARLSGLSGEGNGGFTVVTTRTNFALTAPYPAANYPSATGREMVGVYPLPQITPSYYVRPYTGGSDLTEANAWLAGAAAFYNGTPIPTVAQTLDSLDSMAALLFERWLLLRFLERGVLPAAYAPPAPDPTTPPAVNPNYVTLTRFRAGEAARAIDAAPSGAVYPTAAQLRSLEVAAPPVISYRIASVLPAVQNALRNSADPDIANLRAVVMDVYRISSRYANEVRGAFDPPVGALRQFLATGAVPAGYGNKPPVSPLPGAPYSALTDPQYASAILGLNKVLASVTARTSAVFDLLVRNDTLQSTCTVLDVFPGGSGSVNLVGFDGLPFRFPDSFMVGTGTRLQVTAFTDLVSGACGPNLEVVNVAGVPAVQIVSIPVPTPFSGGGSLLPDDWQLFFFGQTGIDPFASPPGSGLSYLQIYLDGKDPLNPASYAGLSSLLSSLPQPKIIPMGGGINKILFNLPAVYADKFNFQLQISTDLGGTLFGNAPDAFNQTLPGQFEVVLPAAAGPKRFWRVGFSLK